MTESNRFNFSHTESVKDILDSVLEMFASEQSQILSESPQICNFSEPGADPAEISDISEFASKLQSALQALEVRLPAISSGSNVDSMIDVSYCVQKNLKGREAAKFLKKFRRPTPDFPFKEKPPRRRAQYQW